MHVNTDLVATASHLSLEGNTNPEMALSTELIRLPAENNDDRLRNSEMGFLLPKSRSEGETSR